MPANTINQHYLANIVKWVHYLTLDDAQILLGVLHLTLNFGRIRKAFVLPEGVPNPPKGVHSTVSWKYCCCCITNFICLKLTGSCTSWTSPIRAAFVCTAKGPSFCEYRWPWTVHRGAMNKLVGLVIQVWNNVAQSCNTWLLHQHAIATPNLTRVITREWSEQNNKLGWRLASCAQ